MILTAKTFKSHKPMTLREFQTKQLSKDLFIAFGFLLVILLAGTASAQQKPPVQKHLPDTLIFKITAKQFGHMDSVFNYVINNTDSKSVSNAIGLSIRPLYLQIADQMILDSVKDKPKGVVKPIKKVKTH
jgi:hypothetical protein